MPSKLTRRGLRYWQKRFLILLVSQQRWWEAGVISASLVLSIVAVYWWLWRPVAGSAAIATNPNVHLDVVAIEQLTKWADEREHRKASGEVDGRFNELFK